MNRVALDSATAIASLIVLIAAVIVLPAVLPASYAYIASIILFIACMSAGGFYIGQKAL
ncbi:hypothetical protein L1S32_02665 [Methanogenium sp. S4BF]|uniref:hypothetical protein n=1 Tax=Methanogenium sp. S4BF TaxID=1789226 RepID=UPI0024159F35|nr:hypothetical protein [Methanogenium sp. S4BF]WFN35038.1 hypothetical protein L1S32_02665 [Methanogenium sp. S4BF]